MTRYGQPKLMEAARAMPSWTVDPDGTHGEVFTRRWVVDLILDLAGYRAADDLGASVIVEPACGAGAFLVPIAERLAASSSSRTRRTSSAVAFCQCWPHKTSRLARRAGADGSS